MQRRPRQLNTLDVPAINVMRPRTTRQPIVVPKGAEYDKPTKPKRNRFRRPPRQDDPEHEIQF